MSEKRRRPRELVRSESIGITLTKSQKERVRAAATARGFIPSEFARLALLDWVEKWERRVVREGSGSGRRSTTGAG